MKIGVIGAGSWGTALANLLINNSHDVCLWSFTEDTMLEIINYRENKKFLPGIILPNNLEITTSLETAVKDKDLLVLVVPSKAIKQTIQNMKPFLKDNTIIVSASKGLDEDNLLRLSQVIKQVVPKCEVGVLSGPSHAEEVAKKSPTTCVVSFENNKIANLVQDVFSNNTFRVYTNDDIVGVELGGALKNVIALAAGMCDGLGYGDNTKAALMTRGIKEISDLGVAMGGKKNTFLGLTGIGDLIVTCTSVHSRNRKAGMLIGQGESLKEAEKEIGMVVEGANTVKAVCKLSLKYNVDMPITHIVNEVLFNNKNVKDVVNELMTRRTTIEFK